MKIILMVGLPASGKSTVATQIIKDNPDIVVVSADNRINELAASNGMTYRDIINDATMMEDVTRYCNMRINDAAAKGRDILVDQTNLTIKSRRSKIGQVGKKYVKIAYVVSCDHDTWISRCNHRIETRDDHVPWSVLETMKSSYVEPTADEGFDQIIHIDTSRGK